MSGFQILCSRTSSRENERSQTTTREPRSDGAIYAIGRHQTGNFGTHRWAVREAFRYATIIIAFLDDLKQPPLLILPLHIRLQHIEQSREVEKSFLEPRHKEQCVGDEIALQRAANIVVANRDQYVAVFFYASWCPFSKTSLPIFNSMVSLFPNIPHFAFEESVIRPSILSRYGVHGFPTLLLLHSSMRVRYHGSRSISSLTAFYSNVTGIKPTSADKTTKKKAIYLTNLTENNLDQENCPFSWAKSPEKLLQQDTYLILASSFLTLRLLYLILPKLIACVMSLCDYSQVFLHQTKRGFSRLNPWKGTNLKGGAMNAKAWASKSLASVSIGEPSGRAQSFPPMTGD